MVGGSVLILRLHFVASGDLYPGNISILSVILEFDEGVFLAFVLVKFIFINSKELKREI